MSEVDFRRGHLHYFVVVAEEGQITRAARRLHLAQPALSQAIAQLETDLGLQLLERHPRGVTLTAAGAVFLAKAQAAVTAWEEAITSARALAGSSPVALEVGFLGTPPGFDSPVALDAFQRAHPEIDLRYRELAFPHSATAEWLEDVDVAICHRPPRDPEVWNELLRREPRALLVSPGHPLADRAQVSVEEALDEVFIGFHPQVDSAWAGFWSFDDHRGGPPARRTTDAARNPQEVLAAVCRRTALTVVPASVAPLLTRFTPSVRALELSDAEPVEIELVGRSQAVGPQVQALRAFAHLPAPGNFPQAPAT